MREIVLRERQSAGVRDFGACMRRVRDALALQGITRKPRVVFGAPTGFGKSVVFASMAKQAADKGLRVCIILDRRVLVMQTSAMFDAYKIPHAVIMAKSGRFHQAEKIHICSERTLKARGVGHYDMIFIDECHVLSNWLVSFCESLPGALVGGFSATPTTKSCGAFFDDIISPATTNELVSEGLLHMPTIYCAEPMDMTGVKKVGGEWDVKEEGKRATKIVGNAVSDYIEKTNEHFGGPVKTCVFVPNVAAGVEVAQAFAAVGLNFVSISYKDDDSFKAPVLEEFKKRDSSIVGLIAVDMLTRGFDVPDIKCIIILRAFSKSLETLIQIFGRVMRTAEGKTECICNDHGENVIRFRDKLLNQWQNGVLELNKSTEKEKAEKEKTAEEKKEAQCPQCRAVWLGSTDTCSHCGYIRVAKSNLTVVDGKMKKFATKAEAKAEAHENMKAKKQSFYSQLLSIEESRSYKHGWAARKYRDMHGVWPNAYEKTLETPTKEVISWVKAQHTALAMGARSTQQELTA